MAASPKFTFTTKRRTPKRKPPSTTTQTTLSPLITAITTALTSTTTFLNTNDIHLLPSQSLSLHSSLSSALLSLSKLQPHLPHVQTPPPSPSWFHRFLISSTNDDDHRWVDFFRMTKPTFYFLLNSYLFNPLLSLLPCSISPDFALGVTLYRLAHNGSFSFVGKRFGLSSSDSCRAFYAVCKVICDQLGGNLSGFGSELGRVLWGFERIELVNCCGVLGVERFPIEGEVLGKDGFLMVQALVDCNGRFLDVSAGWPSTFTPDSILRQTKLFSSVEESKDVLNGPNVELFDGNLVNQYVLGDSCYPCLPWLLTPFVSRGENEGLSSVEKEYNEVHKRAMGVLRAAFDRVRANWRLLNRRWKEECVEFLPFIIVTACVLNNFLMECGEVCEDSDSGCGREREQDMLIYDGKDDETGARNRELLAMHLSQLVVSLGLFDQLEKLPEKQAVNKEICYWLLSVYERKCGSKAKSQQKKAAHFSFWLRSQPKSHLPNILSGCLTNQQAKSQQPNTPINFETITIISIITLTYHFAYFSFLPFHHILSFALSYLQINRY